jgi:C4-dicarboxylate-specific signal transduction histidine kinase
VDTWVPLIREFGLPLAFLVAFFWALSTRRLVLGSELERKQALLEREIEYRDKLRTEERTSRLKTEDRLAANIAVLRDITEALKDIDRDLIAGNVLVDRPRD